MTNKYVGAIIGAGMVLATVVPAFAVDTTCANDTTGPHSYNKCTIAKITKTRLDLSNSASIWQKSYITANTGDNVSDHNTVGGIITTADAGVAVANSANANDNNVTVQQTEESTPAIGANSITGPGSFNKTLVSLKERVNVSITNDAHVSQHNGVTVNTGGNSNSGNTIGGDIHTGNAIADVTNETTVNTNTVSITQ